MSGRVIVLVIVGLCVLSSCSSSSGVFALTKLQQRYCWPGDTPNTAACPGACQNPKGVCNGGQLMKTNMFGGGTPEVCTWTGGDNWDCASSKRILNYAQSNVLRVFKFW